MVHVIPSILLDLGLAHMLHRLTIILYLVLRIGVASYNIMFDIMQWGLRPSMDMKTNENDTIANYGDVDFELIVDMRLAPLMLLGVLRSPSLWIGSTNDLVISLGLWMVWFRLYTVNGDDALDNEGKIH